jgi:hypothetical protein
MQQMACVVCKLTENKGTKIQTKLTNFGFSHFMSGVSSITRLVEITGSKMLTGGLGTLETIGKKLIY